MVELKGRLVVLRALEREDCRTLWHSFEHTDPPTEDIRPGLSAEGADSWFNVIQAKQEKEQVYLGIFSPDTEVIGDIQLANIDWRHRTASVGFGIARTEHLGARPSTSQASAGTASATAYCARTDRPTTTRERGDHDREHHPDPACDRCC